MALLFNVYCETQYGEMLFLVVDDKRFAMRYTANFQWQVTIDSADVAGRHYTYVVLEGNECVRESNVRRIAPSTVGEEQVAVFDDFTLESDVFQTLPFLNSYFPHRIESICSTKQWTLQVFVPFVEAHCHLALLGSVDALGAWEVARAKRMSYVGDGWWSIGVDSIGVVEYKFVIINETDHTVVHWEDGNNRITDFSDSEQLSVLNLQFRHQFRWRGAGVAVPVFSLRSKSGWGIGEYTDLRLLADWASEVGMRMIQILPVNDTSNTMQNADSYPYRANSIYALHPIYMNMEAVGCLRNEKLQRSFRQKAMQLNASEQLQYDKVMALKNSYLQLMYEQDGVELFASEEYKQFFASNKHWLQPYAVYRCLCSKFGGSDVSNWGEYTKATSEAVERYAEANPLQVGFYYFVQYHAHKQLSGARQYLNSIGIALKGDLPIGISAESVDAWMQPDLFKLDTQAGAPPDDFSVMGQNWGFPTYNWEAMANDGYEWWKSRFAYMSNYFDAYRIDHILGFFRIWTIPSDAIDGILGYFSPALPLSIAELEAYGISVGGERLLCPYITDALLEQKFGVEAPKVKRTFLVRTPAGYEFKPKYGTQKRLKQYLDRYPQKYTPEQQRALYDLFCEVLFVEDAGQKGFYHPRINLQNTYSFACLDHSVQQALCRLHDEYYYMRHTEFWKQNALKRLPTLLKTNNMLVCGEDLGMVPACVPEVMHRLQILSLEVQRMPKVMGVEFTNPDTVPYLSVFTTGTHDTSTLRAWWEEDKERTHRFVADVLHGETMPIPIDNEMLACVLTQCFAAQSMLCVLPLQDVLALHRPFVTENASAERINDPSNPQHYWGYRMKVTLESVLQQRGLSERIKKILKDTGRFA